MSSSFAVTGLCACALWLVACDKAPTARSTPTAPEPASTQASAAAGSAADPSVPSAESVLPPASAMPSDPAQGRSNNAMSKAQESAAMPMPGQNNDHSAPIDPAKRASAP